MGPPRCAGELPNRRSGAFQGTAKVRPVKTSGLELAGVARGFGTVLVDPPWRFLNRTGKVAPEHKRLHRYPTMSLKELERLPVGILLQIDLTSTFGVLTPCWQKA